VTALQTGVLVYVLHFHVCDEIELSTDNTWWVIETGLYGLWFKASYMTLLLLLILLFIARFAV